MHGHWDIAEPSEDAIVEDVNGRQEWINVGVGIVIPVRKIVETLYQEELMQERMRLEHEERRTKGATPTMQSNDLPKVFASQSLNTHGPTLC